MNRYVEQIYERQAHVVAAAQAYAEKLYALGFDYFYLVNALELAFGPALTEVGRETIADAACGAMHEEERAV